MRESSARLRQIELKLKELRSSKAQKPRKSGHGAQAPSGSSSKLDRFRRRSRNPGDEGVYDQKRDDLEQLSKPLRNNFVAINTNSSQTYNEGLTTHRGQ